MSKIFLNIKVNGFHLENYEYIVIGTFFKKNKIDFLNSM